MSVLICGIYRITCRPTGRVYIGQSVDIKGRWKKHRYQLRMKRHGNPFLQAAWRKYGSDAFTFEVVEECPREELVSRELHHIETQKARATLGGFNIAEPSVSVFSDPCVRRKSRDTSVRNGRWRIFEAFGERGTLGELCLRFGVNPKTVQHRVGTCGQSIEDAISRGPRQLRVVPA